MSLPTPASPWLRAVLGILNSPWPQKRRGLRDHPPVQHPCSMLWAHREQRLTNLSPLVGTSTLLPLDTPQDSPSKIRVIPPSFPFPCYHGRSAPTSSYLGQCKTASLWMPCSWLSPVWFTSCPIWIVTHYFISVQALKAFKGY